MRIIFNNTDFILPPDFAAQLTRYNVMLSDAGEQTAPVTLPADDDGINLKLIGYSNRLDNNYKPIENIDVIVTDGLLYRQANLGIHAADEEDGISCTLYFATAEFYSKIGDTGMSFLDWPIYKSPTFDTDTLTQRVVYLINIIKSQYNYPTTNTPFDIRPVLTSQEYTWRFSKRQSDGTYLDEDTTGLFILNCFEKYQHIFDFYYVTENTMSVLEGEYNQRILDGSTVIPLTTGYGITPFLKLRYVLNFIFQSFGYNVDMSNADIISNYYNDKILLINNVADAIYGGKLEFKQLVPNVTIKQFIAEIEKELEGKFVINEVTKTATFYNYSDILSMVPDMDLSKYLTSKPKLGSPEFTTVKLVDATVDDKTLSDSDLPVETIDLNFLSNKVVEDTYGVYSDTHDYSTQNISLDIVAIDGVIHLNSEIQITASDGTVTTSAQDKTPSSLIQLIFIETTTANAVISPNPLGITLKYKRSYRMFYYAASSAFNFIVTRYPAYQSFRLNSNIPVSATMKIPDPVLEKLILHTPKLLNGQKVMIESIVQNLGTDDEQKVNLRTLRNFADIPNPVVYDYITTPNNYANVLKATSYNYIATPNNYVNVLKGVSYDYIATPNNYVNTLRATIYDYTASYSNYKDTLINI